MQFFTLREFQNFVYPEQPYGLLKSLQNWAFSSGFCNKIPDLQPVDY